MSDNEEETWSLKDKGIDTWTNGKKKEKHWKTYKNSDIEILRQKLIEDLETLQDEMMNHLNTDDYKCAFIKKLKQRFGVE